MLPNSLQTTTTAIAAKCFKAIIFKPLAINLFTFATRTNLVTIYKALGYERADLTSAMAVGFATLIPFPGCCRNRVVVGGPPDSVQEMIDDLVGHELVGDWQFEYEDSNTGMVTYSVRVY